MTTILRISRKHKCAPISDYWKVSWQTLNDAHTLDACIPCTCNCNTNTVMLRR